ncbi:MAG: 2-oxoacid:ferredoxin oxidoreductase subunit beta [Promethearchaeota archaeon]|nr:MAG: 2-oxoacid:ferredoxin oxidoreductase subunit beta [Candidatus Lokiarchaeota archaeon]
MEGLGTYAENTWCPGCGNFGILAAFKNAITMLEERGIQKEYLAMSAGIGCHAKIFDYLNINGLYSLHGRGMATIEGMKIANPELKVVVFTGDGDAMGEGLIHVLFGAKRNFDMTVIMHNNGVYALTTGQFTPTSKKGWHGPSTPEGSVEEPFNPLSLVLEAGATFVARAYPGKIKHLTDIIIQAIEHKGFSFLDILQPCVSYNDTWKLYNEKIMILDKIPKDYEESMALAKKRDKLPLGIIYNTKKPVFHEELYGDFNPVKNSLSREQRLEKLKELIQLK